MGGVPRARWSSKQFFRPGLSLSPTPPPPPATSNTTSVGCYAVLCPEESSVEAGRKSRVAADVARKEVEAVEATKRERESMTSANAAGRQQIQTRSSFSKAPPSALPVILTKVSPVGSTEDDAPPSMDSLQRDTSASMMVVVTEKRRSSRKLVRKGEGDTPATAEKDSTWAVSPDNVVKKAGKKGVFFFFTFFRIPFFPTKYLFLLITVQTEMDLFELVVHILLSEGLISMRIQNSRYIFGYDSLMRNTVLSLL